MFKLLLGLVGLVEALYPGQFIRVLTDLSYEYDGEAPTAKPWVVTAARIEGLVLVAVAIRAAIKADRASSMAETVELELGDDSETSSGTVDRI